MTSTWLLVVMSALVVAGVLGSSCLEDVFPHTEGSPPVFPGACTHQPLMAQFLALCEHRQCA